MQWFNFLENRHFVSTVWSYMYAIVLNDITGMCLLNFIRHIISSVHGFVISQQKSSKSLEKSDSIEFYTQFNSKRL